MALPNFTRPPLAGRGALFHGLTRRQEVFLIILVAVLIRLWGFNAPYLDTLWIKQLEVASIAKNFALHGYDIWWPQTDYSADRPTYVEIEFPLVPFLAAVLYRPFGLHEWVGRLVTLGFSLGSLILLYALMRLHLGDRPAAYGLLFFAFAPSNWFYSHVFMTEPAMLFFSVGTLYYFSRWLGLRAYAQGLDPSTPSGGPRLFLVATLFAAFAFLVKLPTVLLLLPLGYLAYSKWGWRMLLRPQAWLFLACALAPALVYYHHARVDIGRHYFTVGLGPENGMWFTLAAFLHPGNWSLMTMRMVRDHLTAVGMVLLPLGLFLRPARPRPQYLFQVWLIAVLIYFLAIWGGNIRQNYYQLPLLLPAAGLIGLAWDRLLGGGALNRLGNLALIALFLVLSAWGVQPFFEQFRPIPAAVATLNRLDPSRQQRLIVFPPGFGCLYYFDRPGWVGREIIGKPPQDWLPEDLTNPSYVVDRIRRGAHWAVYFADNGPGARPDLERYLRRTYWRAEAGAGYEVFDLTRPASQPPPELEFSSTLAGGN